MDKEQRKYIDSHILDSIADSLSGDYAASFNPQDVIDCLRRCAMVVRENSNYKDQAQ